MPFTALKGAERSCIRLLQREKRQFEVQQLLTSREKPVSRLGRVIRNIQPGAGQRKSSEDKHFADEYTLPQLTFSFRILFPLPVVIPRRLVLATQGEAPGAFASAVFPLAAGQPQLLVLLEAAVKPFIMKE